MSRLPLARALALALAMVVATSVAWVGDIDLLGGAVSVRASSPVVLQASSDGTKGTAGLADPPTVSVSVGGQTINVPLNGQPPTGQNVPIKVEVKPVPGEEVTDNNEADFTVIFTR